MPKKTRLKEHLSQSNDFSRMSVQYKRNSMTMKNFLLPALAVVGIALTSAKTKADDGFGVRAESDYYGSYYYPEFSYGPDGYYY
jgi:hypothetical protein